jgi:hypothetical protein
LDTKNQTFGLVDKEAVRRKLEGAINVLFGTTDLPHPVIADEVGDLTCFCQRQPNDDLIVIRIDPQCSLQQMSRLDILVLCRRGTNYNGLCPQKVVYGVRIVWPLV